MDNENSPQLEQTDRLTQIDHRPILPSLPHLPAREGIVGRGEQGVQLACVGAQHRKRGAKLISNGSSRAANARDACQWYTCSSSMNAIKELGNLSHTSEDNVGLGLVSARRTSCDGMCYSVATLKMSYEFQFIMRTKR